MADLVADSWIAAKAMIVDIWPVMVLPMAATLLYVFGDVFLGGGKE